MNSHASTSVPSVASRRIESFTCPNKSTLVIALLEQLESPDHKYVIINTRYQSRMSSTDQHSTWTFLTNHAQVLLCVAETPDIRLRDVAERVGITERATQRILAELVETGYVKKIRVGRRNTYAVDREHAMRHRAQLGYEIGTLLEALTGHD
jgi:DNA-binding transcriptional ArsR family regulator